MFVWLRSEIRGLASLGVAGTSGEWAFLAYEPGLVETKQTHACYSRYREW